MRAREPDESSYAVNDGIRLYYEVFGAGKPTVLLLPTVPVVTSDTCIRPPASLLLSVPDR